MQENRPIAVKHGGAAAMYGISGIILLVFSVAVAITIVREGGVYGVMVIPLLVITAMACFSLWLAVRIARMPEVLIVDADGGIRIMSQTPPLFIAAGDLSGVRVVRYRLYQIGIHAAPIAIRTADREIVIHAVDDVDVVHDRLVAIMTGAAKKSD